MVFLSYCRSHYCTVENNWMNIIACTDRIHWQTLFRCLCNLLTAQLRRPNFWTAKLRSSFCAISPIPPLHTTQLPVQTELCRSYCAILLPVCKGPMGQCYYESPRVIIFGALLFYWQGQASPSSSLRHQPPLIVAFARVYTAPIRPNLHLLDRPTKHLTFTG